MLSRIVGESAKHTTRPQPLPIVTESNAEAYMGSLHGYLTLEAFSMSDAGDDKLVPAFQSVYGGFYTAFGRMFFRSDFANSGHVFAAKLASQFINGKTPCIIDKMQRLLQNVCDVKS